MGKSRRPKFELHLRIYDLNNVPLVSGSSYIKWHLVHSIHAEHRGRTSKCPIVNHRVDYSFSKTVQHIRIGVDKQNHLAECPIEFEVVQEFNVTDKITLGIVKLNLSEYVEESEALVKDHVASPGRRGRASSIAGVSPTSIPATARASTEDGQPEGIVRRHLMQESKINSTLKISILMKQIDGDRSFIAPPLKTAPTFGGIAGIVAHDQATAEEDTAGPTPSTGFGKPRDAAEIQDLYRRTLSASWSRLPTELPADECIEDIFNGGNGWRTQHTENSSTTDTEEDDDHHGTGTLRPSDFRKLAQTSRHHGHRTHRHHQGHRRTGSAASDRSTMTVTARANAKRGAAGDSPSESGLSRSGSLTTLSSERSREQGMMRSRMREVDEGEVRDDLVAWRLPGKDGVAA